MPSTRILSRLVVAAFVVAAHVSVLLSQADIPKNRRASPARGLLVVNIWNAEPVFEAGPTKSTLLKRPSTAQMASLSSLVPKFTAPEEPNDRPVATIVALRPPSSPIGAVQVHSGLVRPVPRIEVDQDLVPKCRRGPDLAIAAA